LEEKEFITCCSSVAFDSVKTPFGEVDEVLGGSATYFSTAASYFTSVSIVAVVGTDFPEKHLTFLKSRKIDIEGSKNSRVKPSDGKVNMDMN